MSELDKDTAEYTGLMSGELAKVAALLTIRTAWSHDPQHRERLDRLIAAGLKLALPEEKPS